MGYAIANPSYSWISPATYPSRKRNWQRFLAGWLTKLSKPSFCR